MSTTLEPTPDAHVWAAIAAVTEHAVKHKLPAPMDITPEPEPDEHLRVYVMGEHEPLWFATLTDAVGNYDDARTTPAGMAYVHAVTAGTLPDTGVRVRITANILQGPARLRVVGS